MRTKSFVLGMAKGRFSYSAQKSCARRGQITLSGFNFVSFSERKHRRHQCLCSWSYKACFFTAITRLGSTQGVTWRLTRLGINLIQLPSLLWAPLLGQRHIQAWGCNISNAVHNCRKKNMLVTGHSPAKDTLGGTAVPVFLPSNQSVPQRAFLIRSPGLVHWVNLYAHVKWLNKNLQVFFSWLNN